MIKKIKELLFSEDPNFFVLIHDLSELSTIDSITALFMSLEDNYDYYDEMNAIMHATERAEPRIVYLSLTHNLQTLLQQSPNWCRTILRRHLSAVKSQGRFDALDFITCAKSDDEAFEIVQKLALELCEKYDFTEEVTLSLWG